MLKKNLPMRGPRILVVGCLGQVGSALVPALGSLYGRSSVVCADVRRPARDDPVFSEEPFFHADVTQAHSLERLVVEQDIDWVVHLASILSVAGEKNPALAHAVNIEGMHNVFQVASKHKLRLLVPSSIAAFGGKNYNRSPTGNHEVQEPTTQYGISKVYLERSGEWYHKNRGLDFRSLRYPGIISHEAEPGGGTTDYAVDIFYQALRSGKYECYLREDTRMPMMYMEDCVRATTELLAADDEGWSTRVFNVGGVDFTPQELTNELRKHVPELQVSYNVDWRQSIADSWPESFDDSVARQDWGWQHKWDLPGMTTDMVDRLRKKLSTKN